ncbi:MAG: response regulator [Gemmatimonadota bacterium]
MRAPESESVRATAEPVSFPAATGSRTALVVEDDHKSAALIRAQLEGEGFTVVHALTAEEALILARSQPISLITLDIMLPDMDGWQFLSLLKETAELRRIPVVIVSIVADATKGFSLGAAAVMQKPVSRQQLVDALADLGMVPSPDGQPLTVLIVDDDPSSVELIAEGVLGLADNVLRASGGREAIEIARRDVPDAIILDLLMPDVNGFDVVVALQGRPETASIPILIITGMQVKAEDRARLNGYVTAIMEKGDMGPGQLTDEVRRAMAGRKRVA